MGSRTNNNGVANGVKNHLRNAPSKMSRIKYTHVSKTIISREFFGGRIGGEKYEVRSMSYEVALPATS